MSIWERLFGIEGRRPPGSGVSLDGMSESLGAPRQQEFRAVEMPIRWRAFKAGSHRETLQPRVPGNYIVGSSGSGRP